MQLALLDLDGVLADERHRVEFALNHQWNKYFDPELIQADAVWEQGRDLVRELQEREFTIAYLTGRRSIVRNATEAWLDEHGFPMGRVLMREPKWTSNHLGQAHWPNVKLAEFKVEVINDLLTRPGIEDVVLFDDDPEVVRAVNEKVGEGHALFCPWNVKPKALVRKAIA